VRAQVAGEFLETLGADENEIGIAQRGVADGVVGTVIVHGLDEDGISQHKMSFEFEIDEDDFVEIDLEGDGLSAIEALDPSLRDSVEYAARKMHKKGLLPEVLFRFADDVYEDEERTAEVRDQLGLGPAEEPSWGDGYEEREVVRIRPEPDKGTVARIFDRFKSGR